MPAVTSSIAIAGSVGKTSTRAMLDAILDAVPSLEGAPPILVVLSAGADDESRGWDDLLRELPADATAVLTADDATVSRTQQGPTSTVTFGLSPSADFRADDIEATIDGTSFTLHVAGDTHEVRLRILGEHQVLNACAALAGAHAAGIPLTAAIAALEAVPSVGPRIMEPTRRADGVVIINDAVGATSVSAAAALKTLALIGAQHRTVAVLGEVDTPAEDSREAHDRIGRLVVRLNIKKLVVVGNDARHIHNAAGLEGSWDGESVLVDTADEAYDLLRDELRTGDIVLVKSTAAADLGTLAERLAVMPS